LNENNNNRQQAKFHLQINAKVIIKRRPLLTLWGLNFNLKLRLKLGKFASGIQNTSSIYGLVSCIVELKVIYSILEVYQTQTQSNEIFYIIIFLYSFFVFFLLIVKQTKVSNINLNYF